MPRISLGKEKRNKVELASFPETQEARKQLTELGGDPG